MHGFNVFHWNLNESGQFLVGYMYKALTETVVPDINTKIWMIEDPS
jgi:hypothetical protein